MKKTITVWKVGSLCWTWQATETHSRHGYGYSESIGQGSDHWTRYGAIRAARQACRRHGEADELKKNTLYREVVE